MGIAMTVTTPYAIVPITGSGTNGPFSAGWPIQNTSHLKVTKVDAGGTSTVLSEGGGASQYSATLLSGGLSGVRVYTNSNLLVGEYLYLERVTPRTQAESITNQGNFYPEVHERAFDKAMMVIQEAEQIGSSAVKFPTADTPGLNQTLPVDSARANKVMGFNASGEPVASNLNLSDLDGFNTALVTAQGAATTATTQAGIATTRASEAATSASQAAASAAGMKRKNPARAATTGALPACTYANGTAGVGATLTANANGSFPAQDGVTLLTGESCLVRNQASSLQNGIFVLTQAGSAGTPWILTRHVDSDTWDEIVASIVTVTEGSTFTDTDFLCTSNAGGTMGTTAITWQAYNSVIGDGAVSTAAKILDGILTFAKFLASEIATTADIVAGTASKIVSAANLAPLFHSARYTQTATTTLPNNVVTAIGFDGEAFEDASFTHNNSTNNSRIPCNFTGRARIVAQIAFASSANARYGVFVKKNGAGAYIASHDVSLGSGVQNILQIDTGVVDVTSGDYFEVFALQGSGVSSATVAAGTWATIERRK